jgi:UV excision repair protein RAD23
VSVGAPATPAQPITASTPSAPRAAPAATPVATPAAAAINPAALQQLTDMGFPQEEAEAALRAAQGNSDLAVEYLMSGIPDHARGNMGGNSPGTPVVSAPASGGGNSDLEMLRRHPQLNELRRLVQANPAALSQVLEAIGQQNPELLRLIHANQADFLAMMNEPITDAPAAPQGQGGFEGDEGEMPNPMQMLQMLQMLPPDQREAAAQSLGMTSEQLQAFSQMVASMPPDQLQRLMGDAARAGGGVPPGANVVRLTDEEMAAVNRLTELGFDQQDAVAAYLSCDKNEALAANLLLEGWSAEDGGGGF